MEAKELRIGNKVGFYKPEIKEIQCGTVLEIFSDLLVSGYSVLIPEFSEYLIPMSINGIAPIPLTEEWMRKLGFITLDSEIDYIEWGLDDNTNGREFNIQSDGFDKPHPLYFVYDIGQGEVKKEIQYVHQLQNLYFALTGQELTIL